MSELFNTIKTSILGTKSADIDKDIDDSFRSIERYSIGADKNKYVEALKNLVPMLGVDTPDDLFKSAQGNPQAQTFDQSGRISRYQEYEAIVRKISYCQRALETLVDNILSPDDITKRSILYLSEPEYEDTTKTVIAKLKNIEKKIELDNKIKRIIRTTLKKGDNFIEVLCSPKGENALTILHEGQQWAFYNKVHIFDSLITENIQYKEDNEKGDSEDKEFKAKIQIEFTSFGGALSGLNPYAVGANISSGGGKTITYRDYQSNPKSKDAHVPGGKDDDSKFKSKFPDEDDGEQGKNDKKLKLKDIFITLHDPKYVIRLETERFKTCLGYLVFPKIDPNLAHSAGLLAAGANSVDALCATIINQLHDKLKTSNDKIKMSKDMQQTLLNYLSKIKSNEDLKIRYVPPELMNHWRIHPDVFDPYGESIFECVNYDCRLLMALKTATTIKRLTYATDKRLVAFETGLPRDARNILEAIKEGMSKKKLSIDTMGSIDNIPSQIPTFETIYIPMRDGKRFVEFDRQEWGMNPQDDVESLKFIRDNIVANLGVPAPYLGLEENMSNRSLLTVENINFCRTIISFQKELSVSLRDLFEKIYSIIWPDKKDELDLITITFQEPKISPYEHQMEYVEQMQRLIEALQSVGIPQAWLKKKYLPHLDWAEIEKYKAEEIIQKETSEESSDQEPGGMGGGMY